MHSWKEDHEQRIGPGGNAFPLAEYVATGVCRYGRFAEASIHTYFLFDVTCFQPVAPFPILLDLLLVTFEKDLLKTNNVEVSKIEISDI